MKLFIWGTGRLSGKVVGIHVKEENIAGYIGYYVVCGTKVYGKKDINALFQM